MSSKPLLLYYGHHKCASRWLVDIIMDVCRCLDLNLHEAHNAGSFDHDIVGFLDARDLDFFAYTNARIVHTRQIRDGRGFHVIRDPRDLLVSAYFSHLYSHSTVEWTELEEHRIALCRCSEEEGMALELDFIDHVFVSLSEWDYDQEEILEIKLENLCTDAYEGLMNVFLHLGLVDPEEVDLDEELRRISERRQSGSSDRRQIERSELLHIIYNHRFSRKADGRKVGQEDPKSHYRRGQAGDWRNHFTPDLTDRFKQRHGNLLLQVGYETDDRW